MTPEQLKNLQILDALSQGFSRMANRSAGLAAPWSSGGGAQPPSLMDAALRRQQMMQGQRQQAAQASLMGGYDPTTGITWNQGRGLPSGAVRDAETGAKGLMDDATRQSLMAPALKRRQAAMAEAYPQQFGAAMMKNMFPTPKDPLIRDFKVGDEFVTRSYNRQTGEWEEMSKAPRYKPEVNVDVTAPGAGDFAKYLTDTQRGKEIADLREKKIQAVQMVKQGTSLVDNLRKAGDQAISWSGTMARGVDTFVSQGQAIARNFGVVMGDGSISKSLNEADWQWGALASESSVIKSKLLGLAVAITKADQGSRPSDFDVQTSINRLAGSAGSAARMADTIQALLQEKMGDFTIRYNSLAPDYDLEPFDWDQELSRHGIKGLEDPLGIR